MTSEERMEFVSARLALFIPDIALDTMQGTGAIAEIARQIVDRWEEDLESLKGAS